MPARPSGRQITMSHDFRLLVFDWDGTLMDSIASIVDCMQATVDHLGLDPIPHQKVRDTVGLGLVDTLEELVPGTDRATRGRIVECYRHLWLSTYRERPVPFPGVRETLESLEHAGYLLAVATGKGRQGLARDFESSGLGRFFHASRTADEAAPKPSPQMLLELLDELGSRPEEALLVDDTTFDLEMAANAGVPSLAVETGSHRREDLLGSAPLDCLASVVELVAWLEDRRSGARRSTG